MAAASSAMQPRAHYQAGGDAAVPADGVPLASRVSAMRDSRLPILGAYLGCLDTQLRVRYRARWRPSAKNPVTAGTPASSRSGTAAPNG
jgi:hypothetical protein